MKYGIDDKPPATALLLYGLQWWIVSLPCVIILGAVVAGMQYTDPSRQAASVQQLFVLFGATMICQMLLGHRLPLIPGPASVLLAGFSASAGAGPDAQYTAVAIGGAILALSGHFGLLRRIRRFFTHRIVAVVLILIAFIMSPVIIRMLFPIHGNPETMAAHFCFLLALILLLIFANTRLPGLAKSLTTLVGIVGGGGAYVLLFGAPDIPATAGLFAPPPFAPIRFAFDGGTLLAFLFCFLALAINEIGSVESVGHMLGASDMDARLRRGISFTGAANIVCGGLGAIGPVDYSLSAGIIAATGCASRFAMIPAGIGLIACGFAPSLVALLIAIPGPVLGVLLLYIMSTQLASGLLMLFGDKGIRNFNDALVVALPLMLGLLVTFSPPAVFDAFPALLRPILANGFVMGIIAVTLLEHWLMRGRD